MPTDFFPFLFFSSFVCFSLHSISRFIYSSSIFSLPQSHTNNITKNAETYPIMKSLRLRDEHSRVFHQSEVFNWITTKLRVSRSRHWRIFTSWKFWHSTTTILQQFHARHSPTCHDFEPYDCRITPSVVTAICHGCRGSFAVHRVSLHTHAASRQVN